MPKPTIFRKAFFWILLGCYSAFFAEVISGSELFPFFKLWGIFVIIPLYGMHTLVLAKIVYRFGKPRLYTLFLAGTIFGLYEAYITKVLWSPPWGPDPLQIGGIAFMATFVLVLFWHPIMAFIVPLLVSERALTRSRTVIKGLPGKLQAFLGKRRTIILLVILAAVFQSVNTPSPGIALVANSSSVAVLLALTWLWNRSGGPAYSLRELLPGKWGFALLSGGLLLMYLVMGLVVRPEALPGFFPQFLIWQMYAFLGFLLALSLWRSRRVPLGSITSPFSNFSPRGYLFLWGIFLLVATSFALLKPISNVFALIAWFAWILIGFTLLGLSFVEVLKPVPKSPTPATAG